MATLADLARQYLSQSLPDISGIFSLRKPFSPASTSEVVNQTSSPAGLTSDQLRLLYPQIKVVEMTQLILVLVFLTI